MNNSANDAADALLSFVNMIGADRKAFVRRIISSHRTLQQSAFRVFMDCIYEWSKQEDFDLRNEETIKKSRKIIEALSGDHHVPFI